MVDNKKPLVGNKDGKKFDELYAIEILKLIAPSDYTQLEHGEKPDIHDGIDIGIEVTRACNENMQAAMNLWNLSFYADSDEKAKKNREQMGQRGEKYQGGCQRWNHAPCSDDDIKKAVEKKIKKIDSYKYDTMDLYVTTDFGYFLPAESNEKFGEKYVSIFSNMAIKFRYIYIDISDRVFKFDINQHTYIIFDTPYYASIGEKVKKIIFNDKSKDGE